MRRLETDRDTPRWVHLRGPSLKVIEGSIAFLCSLESAELKSCSSPLGLRSFEIRVQIVEWDSRGLSLTRPPIVPPELVPL